MATRKPVSVLPDPVGEATSTSCPAAMWGQAAACGEVGPARKRRANQPAPAGGVEERLGRGRGRGIGHRPIPPGGCDADERGRRRAWWVGRRRPPSGGKQQGQEVRVGSGAGGTGSGGGGGAARGAGGWAGA